MGSINLDTDHDPWIKATDTSSVMTAVIWRFVTIFEASLVLVIALPSSLVPSVVLIFYFVADSMDLSPHNLQCLPTSSQKVPWSYVMGCNTDTLVLVAIPRQTQ